MIQFRYNQSFQMQKGIYKSNQDYVLYVFNNTREDNPNSLSDFRRDVEEIGMKYRYERFMTKDSIKGLIRLSDNGLENICHISKLPSNYEDMSFNELCQYLEANPSLLKGLIVSDGYNVFHGWKHHAKSLFTSRFKQLRGR